jgi:hypothetical protein
MREWGRTTYSDNKVSAKEIEALETTRARSDHTQNYDAGREEPSIENSSCEVSLAI